MTHKKEMEQYRSRFRAKITKRGRRKSDVPEPPYFDIGLVLDFAVIVLVGLMVALSAWIGRHI